IARALDELHAHTTVSSRHVRRSWAGLRTFAPDRGPVIGFDGAARGFFWLVGQGGTGIQTAPAQGRVAAELLLDGRLPADVAALGLTAAELSPARFDR
ncbi:MAG: FAD-dependent oxidoreductase, partial [Acidimicrobiia bacterium]|nr:FAD-dependent oxidoreductase [Acidimicrobiia bacterium]